MAVKRGSRYEYAAVDYIPTGFDQVKVPSLFYSFDTIGSVKYREYIWVSGDRPDILANKFYGSPEMWWVIAEHNPEISDFLSITPGTVLRIPNA